MTETEWLAWAWYPLPLVEFLLGEPRIERIAGEEVVKFNIDKGRERKLRLFNCACGRQAWDLLPEDAARDGVDATELWIEGHIPARELEGKLQRLQALLPQDLTEHVSPSQEVFLLQAVWCVMEFRIIQALSSAVVHFQMAFDNRRPGREERQQCRFLHCIFGPLPFRQVPVDPAWLTPTILQLAQAAYENRHLPEGTLEATRLAVLADALEEAGCTNGDILSHLRGPGPHVRGCWPLDLLLGKD